MSSDHAPAGRSPYIRADEIKALLPNPRLVLLDARIRRSTKPDGTTVYSSGLQSFREDGHIPGAIFADLFATFSDAGAPFPFTRPSADKLAQTLWQHGINERSTVIAYDSLNGAWAARLWWVLTSAGLPDVRLLNGGLSAWVAAGGQLAFGEAGVSATDKTPNLIPRPDLFADLPDVLAILDRSASARLVCALREAEFKVGHIPGSSLIPYASLLTPDAQVDPALAARAAEALQLAKHDRLVLYCGGGVNAAGLGIALLTAEFTDVSVYDGSLSEWKADPSRPLARLAASS